MVRQKIEGSSNITESGYDHENMTLEIKFHNGKIYQYWPITLKKYRGFIESKSKGSFFASEIKNNPRINFKQLDGEIQS